MSNKLNTNLNIMIMKITFLNFFLNEFDFQFCLRDKILKKDLKSIQISAPKRLSCVHEIHKLHNCDWDIKL